AIAAVLMRHTRSAMLQVLSSDYVRTARAKGLDERTVVLKHALRNALIPIITLGALEFGTLLSGAVLTEQVFSIPGFGKLIGDGLGCAAPRTQRCVALWRRRARPRRPLARHLGRARLDPRRPGLGVDLHGARRADRHGGGLPRALGRRADLAPHRRDARLPVP